MLRLNRVRGLENKPVLISSSVSVLLRTTIRGVRIGESLTLLAFLPKKSRVLSRKHEPRKHAWSRRCIASTTQVVVHIGSNLPLLSALQRKDSSSVNWKRFRQAWDNYEIAARLKTQDKEFRTATLLTCIGQDALDIFDGLAFDEEAQKKDIDIVLQKLEEFYVGNKNEIYERYLFNKRDQAAGESIDTYVFSLRSWSKTCNYGTLTDNLIRDRMVFWSVFWRRGSERSSFRLGE